VTELEAIAATVEDAFANEQNKCAVLTGRAPAGTKIPYVVLRYGSPGRPAEVVMSGTRGSTRERLQVTSVGGSLAQALYWRDAARNALTDGVDRNPKTITGVAGRVVQVEWLWDERPYSAANDTTIPASNTAFEVAVGLFDVHSHPVPEES